MQTGERERECSRAHVWKSGARNKSTAMRWCHSLQQMTDVLLVRMGIRIDLEKIENNYAAAIQLLGEIIGKQDQVQCRVI